MGLKENIKSKRLELGLTLEEVANKIGVKKPTLQRYESGVISNIPSDKIESLAKVFDISPSVLMGWEEEKKETKSSSDTNPINEHEEEKDIEKIIDELMEQQGLMLCGKPMSKNSLMLLRNSIRSTLELAKSMNEEKEKNNK